MSGHSKWHSIKHKKGAADAKRGKIFTRHAKLITIAAQSGGDASMNPRLRLSIDNAKAAGVPNANIDRAIKRGTGELGGDKMEELTYEGYAPGGVAVLIRTLTDNRNRTVQEVRNLFSKNGGNMGDAGSVAYLFKSCGVILAKIDPSKAEEIELLAIDAGADEVNIEGDELEVIAPIERFETTKEALIDGGLTLESSELTYLPQTTVTLATNQSEKVQRLIEALEELDDVDEVFSNAEFPEEQE